MADSPSVNAQNKKEQTESNIARSHLDSRAPPSSLNLEDAEPSNAETKPASLESNEYGPAKLPSPPSPSNENDAGSMKTAPSPSDDPSHATPLQNPSTENRPSQSENRSTDQEPPDNNLTPNVNQPPPPPSPTPFYISRQKKASGFTRRGKKLSRWLPHLKVLSKAHLVESGKITIMDYVPGQVQSLKVVSQHKSSSELQSKDVRQWVNAPRSMGHHRIIIVEDLTSKFMAGLDLAFNLNPEMFAEHLSKSKYGYVDDDSDASEDDYTDPSDLGPATWSFRSEKKDYVSLRWFRPIYTKTHEIPLRHLERMKKFGYASWEDRGNERLGEAERMIHSVKRKTNIFRQERHLSAAPERLLKRQKQSILATVEERATIYRRIDTEQPFVLLLLDPLPAVSHTKRPRATRTSRKDQSSEIEEPVPLVLFTHVCPRSPAPISSLCGPFEDSDYERMQKFFEETRSAGKDIEDWLTKWKTDEHSNNVDDVLAALLQVVSSDMDTFLRLLSVALSDIGLGSSNDATMQELLAHWRIFVNSYQAELPDIKQSLEDFQKWAFGDDETESTSKIFEVLKEKFDKLIKETEKAHEAIRAEMSILESKRGIAEAEGVSKLTELAFVYIPLTFAASLFSMQIRQFQNPAPLSSFIAACVILMTISYGTRLLIRSTFMIELKRRWLNEIRKQPGTEERIPTHTFIKWALRKAWNFVSSLPDRMFFQFLRRGTLTVLIFAIGGLVSIITPLWVTMQLDLGFKVAMTLLLTGLVALASIIAIFARGRIVFRGRQPGQLHFFKVFSLFSYRWQGRDQLSSSASDSGTGIFEA